MEGAGYQVLPMSAPPSSRLPVWGRRIEFDDFFVELVPPGKRVLNVPLNNTFASINFGPSTGVSSVRDGRLKYYERKPFEYFVAPPDFVLSGSSEFAPEVLVLVFDFEFARPMISSITGLAVDVFNPHLLFGRPSPFVTTLAKKIRSLVTAQMPPLRYLESLCITLIAEMCSSAEPNEVRAKASWPESDAIKFLLQHIDVNIAEELAVEHLAKLVGCSSDQLCRCFKKMIGETPHSYVLQRRVDIARCLLGNKTMSLAEIAYTTGFSSQSHMTTAFTRTLGVTPGALRHQTP